MGWLSSIIFGVNGPSPSTNRRTSPPARPATRPIRHEKIVPVSPSTDGTLSPKISSTPTSDKTVVSQTTAEAATMSLDLAVAQMKESQNLRAKPVVLDAYETLGEVRSLIQRVRYQQSLQTPNVMAALDTLSSVLDELVTCTEATASVTRFKNVMDEIDQASRNLRQQFPGHFSVAKENKAVDAFQICAAIGLKVSDERVVAEARGNEAERGVQINAPIMGDTAFLSQIAVAFAGK